MHDRSRHLSVAGNIALRGVAVHNLKSIDLDIPHGKLVVLCGLSGSGKSSLAMDTLYAEGQRRYIESFSAYTRQFLDRLEKPEAERIDGLPPAIAVTGGGSSRSSRSTVATTTEVADYLRLLFAKIGTVVCRECGKTVGRDTPESVAARLGVLPAGTRYMVAFGLEAKGEPLAAVAAGLREEGFVRAIVGERMVALDTGEEEGNSDPATDIQDSTHTTEPIYVVVDRLSVGGTTEKRATRLPGDRVRQGRRENRGFRRKRAFTRRATRA